MKSKLPVIVALMSCCLGTARAEKKEILIIRGTSTHGKDSHNNDEVGQLLEHELEASFDRGGLQRIAHHQAREQLGN